MDIRIIAFVLGKLAQACGLALIIPLAASLFYWESSLLPFLAAIAVSLLVGRLLIWRGREPQDSLTVREGIAITALGWIMVTLLGMVPYAAGGYLPVLDSIFECISGLSGTGATVIDDVESLPQSLLLWRSLTHWFGGLGIIVIFIAVFPQFGKGIVHMFNAESTGPRSDRTLPRIKEMAKALFTVYVLFTVVSAIVFWLCGMTPLIAVDHAFSTIATGGFSPYNNSVAHFNSPLIEVCLAFFMIISSANFGMYVAVWKKGFKVILHDTEFRVYLGTVAVTTAAMALNLVLAQHWDGIEALRQAFFQSVSISSSTGFVSNDFEQWPVFSKFILLGLMFVGGCAGSTTGGLKVTRAMLLVKTLRAIIHQKMHPRQVMHIRSNGEEFSLDLIYGVAKFFFVYTMLGVLWTFIMVFDGVAIFDAIGLSISTMGSCGPGFGQFGATATCSALPPLSKTALCFSMLMGRLEAFPVLAILMPSFWRHRNSW
ncbi:TrkH family potassium uptake protein [uncultured Megasphaera sp.]|uniref:TrkH family potassium uptake protein n=1 Tax=uncultured Megasphaera sp. TaxID=165188 RepID=UPI0025F72CC2|nr:TrkH family potassium uptake protein [uncultured Megasphaera sp.]